MEFNLNKPPNIIENILRTKKDIELELNKEIDNIKKANLFIALINIDKKIEYYKQII